MTDATTEDAAPPSFAEPVHSSIVSPEALATPAVDSVMGPPAPPEARLRFTVSGADYFRIWAVNLTLTILTLGLYSAWAKVRRLQYFYRHTELDGAVFDYVASPVGILLGRVLALILLVLYYLAFEYSPWAGAAVTVLLAAVLPYLLWQSNRFKARNTRYRGLAFGFVGTVRDAYRVYLPAIIITFGPTVAAALWLNPRAESLGIWLSVATLLLLPFLHAMYRRYLQANLRYGATGFDFSAKNSDFASVWAWGLGVMFVAAIGIAFIMIFVGGIGVILTGQSKFAVLFVILVLLFSVWLPYQLIGSFFTARFQKLVWEQTCVGAVSLRSDISATGLLRIQAVNALWVVLSLGLYRPFAAIRVARYRLESVTVLHVDALNDFLAAADGARSGATGDSAAEFFEMDVGL